MALQVNVKSIIKLFLKYYYVPGIQFFPLIPSTCQFNLDYTVSQRFVSPSGQFVLLIV